MEKEKNKSSKNFRDVKDLYHNKKLKIKSVSSVWNKENSYSEVIFDDNGKDKVIKGDEVDFMDLANLLRTTFRNGKEQIVDISSLSVKDTNKYYENLEKFVGNEKSLKEATERIKTGKSKLSRDVDLKKGLASCLDKDFSNKNAREIIDNYFDSLALIIFQMKPISDTYSVIKSKLVQDPIFFSKCEILINKVFKDNVMKLLPLDSFNKFSKCTSDIPLLSRHFVTEIEKQKLDWKSLYTVTGGTLKGEEGIKRLLDEYAKVYEIIRGLMRDFAFLLKEKTDQVDLSSMDSILKFISSKGYKDIVEFITPYLRHGSTHFNLEYKDKGKVSIYDTINKDRKLVLEASYEDIIEKHKKIKDFAFALIFNFIMFDMLIDYRLLESPDFKFFIIENKSS